jgi:hypothetical protein
MRCPYCGGLNADQAVFCARCGRDLTIQSAGRPRSPVPQQPPIAQPPARPQPVQAPATSQMRTRPSQARPPVPPAAQPTRPPHSLAILPDQFAGVDVIAPTGPEAPAPFPPHTLSHLHALEVGALEYSVVSDDSALGSKRIVRILYARCIHWQQVATLLKACKEFQSEKYSTLIVQGLYNREPNLYSFNNGQLVFDRGVRLGSQVLNRYQIETGTGYEGEALRIVMTE